MVNCHLKCNHPPRNSASMKVQTKCQQWNNYYCSICTRVVHVPFWAVTPQSTYSQCPMLNSYAALEVLPYTVDIIHIQRYRQMRSYLGFSYGRSMQGQLFILKYHNNSRTLSDDDKIQLDQNICYQLLISSFIDKVGTIHVVMNSHATCNRMEMCDGMCDQ